MPYSSVEWPARSLLGVVAPEARRELLELGVPARFEAGKVLLSEGARTRHMLVLLSGFAKVTARVENGEESLLAVRVGGDSVGEMAALDGSPRSATVTACGLLSAMVVQPAALHTLLARRPEVHLALTRILADRLRWANRRRLDFKGYPAKVRLARLLVELATRYGRPVEDGTVLGCRLTQPELAALTGAAETTIHKGLRELRREGLLETGYGSTLIRELDRLREIGDLAPED
ncbi:Crp/Fnr family transcriptional regulator [Streptomyces sp. NPDC006372]|uniref:Crp/Fnr family transcriptional regulator n=1 Tax=Streptomyces sp. NPDC006372 TaxID=3155599 RepID=UPI0033AE3A69